MKKDLPQSYLAPGYSPVGDCEVFGTHFVGLLHDSGSRLVFPASTVSSMGRRPEIAEITDRIAQYGALHNGYHHPERIADQHPVDIFRRSKVDLDTSIGRRATLYGPRSKTGEFFIKAFDLAPNHESVVQFAVMAALYDNIHRHDFSGPDNMIRLRSPRQYAIVQPPSGKHRTIVMERVKGVQLNRAMRSYPASHSEESRKFIDMGKMFRKLIRESVAASVDESLQPYLNDVTGHRFTNTFILEAPETYPEDIFAARDMIAFLTIIDQPHYPRLPHKLRRRNDIRQIARLLNLKDFAI